MAFIATIVVAPAESDGAAVLLSPVTRRIERAGHDVSPFEVGPLARGHAADQAAAIATADALLLAYATSRADAVEVFLDRLPPASLSGTPVLVIAVCGTGNAGTSLPTLLRRLRHLGAVPAGDGVRVPVSHVRAFADGGVLVDPASAVPVAQAVESFLAGIGRSAPGPAPAPARRVSPVAGAPDLTVRSVQVGDPELRPLLDELVVEYGTRYAHLSAHSELTEVPASDFLPPDGAFLVVTEHGESVAGGALRRYDQQTAEVKRVWTSSRHRRRGLAQRVMAELERKAVELGYLRVHLTTGPRQPEARALYLATGYQPRFDVTADPETIGPLAFGKELVRGAGLADWVQPTWAQAQATFAGAAR